MSPSYRARGRVLVAGGDQPAAVVLVAQEGRETGVGVEPRETQPVDRAGTAHERRRVRVADEGVLLQWERHRDIVAQG